MKNKSFYTMYNIGKSKYVINSNDGIKTHKDNSLFYDIEIFSNKKNFNTKIKQLLSNGYIEEGII
jgi:hypothetical protein